MFSAFFRDFIVLGGPAGMVFPVVASLFLYLGLGLGIKIVVHAGEESRNTTLDGDPEQREWFTNIQAIEKNRMGHSLGFLFLPAISV